MGRSVYLGVLTVDAANDEGLLFRLADDLIDGSLPLCLHLRWLVLHLPRLLLLEVVASALLVLAGVPDAAALDTVFRVTLALAVTAFALATAALFAAALEREELAAEE